MAKKKKVYKISLLWTNILCIISTILGILGIVMFCSMPELREVPGLLSGSLILGLSIILIVLAMCNFIAEIWALKGTPKKLQCICKVVYIDNSKEDKDMINIVKMIAILTIILVILMALSFFF